MLNKDLIDKRDIKIATLEKTIEQFKRYDEERKSYYKKALERLGELESLLSEIEENGDKKQRIILQQRIQLNKLNLLIKSKELEVIPLDNEEEFENLREKEQNILLRKKNRKLMEDNKRLRNTITELLIRFNKEGLV